MQPTPQIHASIQIEYPPPPYDISGQLYGNIVAENLLRGLFVFLRYFFFCISASPELQLPGCIGTSIYQVMFFLILRCILEFVVSAFLSYPFPESLPSGSFEGRKDCGATGVFCFSVLQRKREVLGRNAFMGKDG